MKNKIERYESLVTDITVHYYTNTITLKQYNIIIRSHSMYFFSKTIIKITNTVRIGPKSNRQIVQRTTK